MMRISGKEGRPYSILFRGCSFLIVYEVGVFSALRELFPDMLKSASRIYGSSSGSVTATIGLCGCDPAVFRDTFVDGLTTSFWGFVPGGRIIRTLRYALDKCLPPNAHELVSGKLHIILTRLHDWKSITVSEFTSKEELIQAVTCSCYIPVYFGFIPPTYHGVRYVDGELAMWTADFVTRSTITVSAFAGEYDICPKDGPAAFFTFQCSDCILQISKRNLCRFQHIFQFPTRQVLNRFFVSGYLDTVSFLRRLNDFSVDYFEGFTLSFTNGSQLKEDPGTILAAEEEEGEAPQRRQHPQKGPGQLQKSIFAPIAAFCPDLYFEERMKNLQPKLKAELN